MPNSFKSLFPMLSDSELKELKQSCDYYSCPRDIPEHVEACKAAMDALKDIADVACPMQVTGFRQSDIRTLMETTDRRVFNTLADAFVEGNISTGIDTSTMSAEQVAELAIPRDADMSFAEQLAAQALEKPAVSAASD